MAGHKHFTERSRSGCHRNLSAQFRTYWISREPVHEWVRRILAGDVAPLADRSHVRQYRAGEHSGGCSGRVGRREAVTHAGRTNRAHTPQVSSSSI